MDSSPNREKTWAQVETGRGMAGEQPCRTGSEGAGRQQGQQEPAVCPGHQESKPHLLVHQTQYNQLVKKIDYPTVFSTGAASP